MNDRINIASIGVGGMGGNHLGSLLAKQEKQNVRYAGVCDVYQRRLHAAAQRVACEGYADYRKLLDNKDIVRW